MYNEKKKKYIDNILQGISTLQVRIYYDHDNKTPSFAFGYILFELIVSYFNDGDTSFIIFWSDRYYKLRFFT